MKQLFTFLQRKEVLGVALGLLVSTSVGDLTKGFTDDLVLPMVDPLLKLVKIDKLTDAEVNVFGAKLRVGKFFQTLIRFLIMIMITIGISKLLKA